MVRAAPMRSPHIARHPVASLQGRPKTSAPARSNATASVVERGLIGTGRDELTRRSNRPVYIGGASARRDAMAIKASLQGIVGSDSDAPRRGSRLGRGPGGELTRTALWSQPSAVALALIDAGAGKVCSWKLRRTGRVPPHANSGT